MSATYYDKDPSWKENKKFNKFLSEGEELELVTGYSRHYLRQKFITLLFLPGALFILIGLGYTWFFKINLTYGLLGGLFVAIIIAAVWTWMIKISHLYLLTGMRVIVGEGLFNLKVNSIMFDKITHVEIDQKLMDRLFLHHGTVHLHTAGGLQDDLVLRYVEYPLQFESILKRLIEIERKFLTEEAASVSLGQIESEKDTLLHKI